jgi:hypothetical protein
LTGPKIWGYLSPDIPEEGEVLRMEELKAQAVDVLSSLDEDQLRAVLAYARSLLDGEVLTADLEELLLENPS